MHPLFGQTVTVVQAGRNDTVLVRTADERRFLLRVRWTSIEPRANPPSIDGVPVRLSPESLVALSCWVSARRTGSGSKSGQVLAVAGFGREKRPDAHDEPRHDECADAVVGEADPSGSGCRSRGEREEPG